MITTPLLPDDPAKAVRGAQDGVASLGAGTPILPWLTILARRNNVFRTAPRNGFMAAFRVLGRRHLRWRSPRPR